MRQVLFVILYTLQFEYDMHNLETIYSGMLIIFNIIYVFKEAMPVSFRSILFTSYILTIFKQQNLLPYL